MMSKKLGWALFASIPVLGLIILVLLVGRARQYAPVEYAPPERMPEFPWPPPQWTSRYVLPDGLATTGEGESLGDIYWRIVASLEEAQIYGRSVYSVGDDGFAIVTYPESIEEDGTPLPPPARWRIRPRVERPRSLAEFFRALLDPQPGRYRFMVLLVTSRPVTPGPLEPDTVLMDSLARSGAGALPWDMEMLPLGPSGRCEALIYEFYRQSDNDPTEFVLSSEIPARQHLAAAGLWPEELQ